MAFLAATGWANVTPGHLGMIGIGSLLIYLGIVRKYEPLLLIPIGFGMILGNIPMAGLMREPVGGLPGGLLYYLFQGVILGFYPPLIFLGIGAMTDFGPLIANPKMLVLGAAAQFGIFTALLLARLGGFLPAEAASIAIIGGADGPTAIYTTIKMAPHLLGPIAVAAYSYIALVPLIQPPIIRLMTTARERAITMKQLRPVSRRERILFPVIVTVVTALLVPLSLPLVGMLMFGNLLKESGVVDRLVKTSQNEIVNVVTIFLALTVGASAEAGRFFSAQFLGILALGLFAFIIGTASGLAIGKVMCWLTRGEVNPMLGAAGVSAVPEAARLCQHLGHEVNPKNYLLMHAMAPNVAGVIGSAVAAGVLLTMVG